MADVSLSKLQAALEVAWTDELYSAEFKASPSRYKHFDLDMAVSDRLHDKMGLDLGRFEREPR